MRRFFTLRADLLKILMLAGVLAVAAALIAHLEARRRIASIAPAGKALSGPELEQWRIDNEALHAGDTPDPY